MMSDTERQHQEVQALNDYRPPRSNEWAGPPICKGNRRACNCWARRLHQKHQLIMELVAIFALFGFIGGCLIGALIGSIRVPK